MSEQSVEKPLIKFDDFQKLDLKVGRVTECTVHPDPSSTKLLVMKLDMGNGQVKQICAGIREHTTPDRLMGKSLIVVTNLEPRKMRGVLSEGMILAATDSETKMVLPLKTDELVTPGSKVG